MRSRALLPNMTPHRYQAWTRAALWSLTIIVVSGGAVRLTGSGLGCSDWPTCEQDQLVADLEYHALVEFVNRMFTGVVAVAVVVAVLGSLGRVPRRNDLSRWSWGLVAGVIGQILLGAILVKTDLDPRFTMGHFLLSMVLLWNAVVLHHRAGLTDGDEPQPLPERAPSLGDARSRGRLRNLVRAVAAAGAVLLVTGTIVTGSGPHSGSDEAEAAKRLPFLVRDAARLHSVVAMGLLGLVLAVIWASHIEGRFDVRRRAEAVGVLLVVQGAIGYLQYFTGVPVLLVAVHITLASITWISIVRLHLELRHSSVRESVPEPV